MAELSVRLQAQVDVDLSALFDRLADEVLGVDFGDLRFDAGGVLAVVAGAESPRLAELQATARATAGGLAGRLEVGVPGGELTGAVDDLVGRLASLRPRLPELAPTTATGVDALGDAVAAVRAAVETGPLAALLRSLPGVGLDGATAQVAGPLGGLLELLRVVGGLAATATASRQLADRATALAGVLDPVAARAAGETLGRLSADTTLVTGLRRADPADPEQVERLGRRVVEFLDAVFAVGDGWSAGMGFGEAALVRVAVPGSAVALGVAGRALADPDLAAVAELTAAVRAVAAPLLDLPLPDPPTVGAGLVDQALALVGTLTTGVRDWDARATLDPLLDAAELVLTPVRELEAAVQAVGTAVTGAVRGVRDLVAEVDLTPVATAVRAALQPVVDLLDGLEAEIGAAEAVLDEVTRHLVAGLEEAGAAVGTAAETVTAGLGRARDLLRELRLDELGAALAEGLRDVAARLAAARLTPYFDTAVDVSDTAAAVIGAVPFGLLPTDVQQDVVDACRPVRELDLQPLEDDLRAELRGIRDGLRGDALAELEAAYAAVVAFLASLDPAPHLVALEAGPFAELRGVVAAIDPAELLRPVEEALAGLRGLLADVDLERDVLAPLDEVFSPLLDALDAVDPQAVLAGVVAEVDRVRASLAEVARVDEARAGLEAFRRAAADGLARLDVTGLAAALDAPVATALARLPEGPPLGPLGSVLASVTQASGLPADEPGIGDVVGWLGGEGGGPAAGTVVRERLRAADAAVGAVRDAVLSLDPMPLAAAAAAQHRALVTALAAHPADSPLRRALDPRLDRVRPADVLGPLAERRRRYLRALEADGAVLTTLAASGRSEVTGAVVGLRAALLPLAVVPARLRALLDALGLDAGRRPWREVVERLLAEAGPARLVPALAGLAAAVRDQLLVVLDLVVAAGLSAVDAVSGALDALDVTPVVTELAALHREVRDEVAALAPRALLGEAVAAADDVVARLEAFDPLADVREVVDAARRVTESVLQTARPTVVFAPVTQLHADVLRIAGGLDVVVLLGPVLDALDALVVQLDEGFDRAGDALQRLQAALPSAVTSSALGGTADVGVDLGVGL